jgi:TonB-dependent Receptor Plug Domain/CarboxypepD_reg-like domain
MCALFRYLFLFSSAFLFLSPAAYSQYTVSGKVIDAFTKEPLEFAAITNSTGKIAVLTDHQGNFILKRPSKDTTNITISFMGYKSRSMNLKPGTPAVIRLEKGSIDLKEVVVTSNPALSVFHTLSRIDLNQQPVNSAQDLLRLVPGLFIAQHQGGGKAEQIFLRGFDADHGTDVNVSVDGIPVNMVSHAHGQGYADLHFLIPEIVANYDFGKGPYYTGYGDFTTAGYVAYNTRNVLDHNTVALEGGQFNTGRVLAMINLLSETAKQKGQSAYIAGDALYSDGGPFDLPEHFHRFNLFGKFNTAVGDNSRLTLSAMTMDSRWRSSGEIPHRAVAEGYIGSRWGALDSSQGGSTTRTNLNLKLTTFLKNDYTLENQAWYSHYYFNLISNFTFFDYFPTTGDEFRQHEKRDLMGYNTRLSKKTMIGSTSFTSTAGAGFRYDHIEPSELDHTIDGGTIEAIQLGHTRETSVFAHLDETIEAGKWLFNFGVRADYFHFYYLNIAPAADTFASKVYAGISPEEQKTAISPKLNVQYTFSPRVQVYVKAGKGFHSNDARVVIANQGIDILPAAYGADLGANWKPIPQLFINTAFWHLYLKQEFTFGADLIDQPGGPVGPSGRTSRMGIDFSARYQFTDWLFASMNANLAKPSFIDSAAGHNYVPLAPTFTSTAGLDFRLKNGLNGGISYRYMHNRSANETYTLTAVGYWVTDLTLNYTKKRYSIGLAIENLLNVTWNESQFEYASRLKYEAQPVDEVSYTPGVPFFAKLKFAVFF